MPLPVSTVLFLCTGNYYRSRFAELFFNALAAQSALPWRADSRGLALERGVHNVGPISAAAAFRLRALGIDLDKDLPFPRRAVLDDFERANLVIALKEAEHRPLLEQRFPAWADRVEYWHIHDVDCGGVPEALAGIEAEVRVLTTRLKRAAT